MKIAKIGVVTTLSLALLVAAACSSSGASLVAQAGELAPPEEAGDGALAAAQRERRYRLEMHWGFVYQLGEGTDAPALLLPMDGQISIADDDPATREGIHLVGALLFEADGAYQQGRDDEVMLPQGGYSVEGVGHFYPWVGWRSATTDDWDGMGVFLAWQRGSNAIVTIQAGSWSARFPAEELVRQARVIDVGSAGQKLEIGPFFGLSYKVYDLLLQWGYEPSTDANPAGPQALVSWDGSLALDQGGVRVLKTEGFEGGGSYERGRNDRLLPRQDLSPTVSWGSSTLDTRNGRAETDGLALNLVVPKGAVPPVHITVGGYQTELQLPRQFKDIHQEEEIDTEGHGVHLHLHWCWWKSPS